MATYAAFKHVELYNVGKTKKRVLRPPGGGSSDIFGTEAAPPTPRSVRNHMASNIFGSTTDTVVKNSVRQGIHRFYFIGDSARRGQKNVDSYSRLFGEPERPFTPAKNHMKSSIPIGPNAAAADTTDNSSSNNTNKNTTNGSSTQVNGHEKNGKIENGDQQNNVTKTDGNPVTGEGYKPAGAEINTSIPCLNGANQVINKNRIPPGGYSSGLW